MKGPLVSVIVPCYNAARFLPEALATIRAQRYEPLEILVVDDGSTDNTPDVVSGFGSEVRYLRKPNGGPASARNLGLREARGEWIAFLDADDQWPEGKLELQAGRLRDRSVARRSHRPHSVHCHSRWRNSQHPVRRPG